MVANRSIFLGLAIAILIIGAYSVAIVYAEHDGYPHITLEKPKQYISPYNCMVFDRYVNPIVFPLPPPQNNVKLLVAGWDIRSSGLYNFASSTPEHRTCAAVAWEVNPPSLAHGSPTSFEFKLWNQLKGNYWWPGSTYGGYGGRNPVEGGLTQTDSCTMLYIPDKNKFQQSIYNLGWHGANQAPHANYQGLGVYRDDSNALQNGVYRSTFTNGKEIVYGVMTGQCNNMGTHTLDFSLYSGSINEIWNNPTLDERRGILFFMPTEHLGRVIEDFGAYSFVYGSVSTGWKDEAVVYPPDGFAYSGTSAWYKQVNAGSTLHGHIYPSYGPVQFETSPEPCWIFDSTKSTGEKYKKVEGILYDCGFAEGDLGTSFSAALMYYSGGWFPAMVVAIFVLGVYTRYRTPMLPAIVGIASMGFFGVLFPPVFYITAAIGIAVFISILIHHAITRAK